MSVDEAFEKEIMASQGAEDDELEKQILASQENEQEQDEPPRRPEGDSLHEAEILMT